MSEQIIRTVGPTETRYTDVSEEARGAGMEKVGIVFPRESTEYPYGAISYFAGGEQSELFESRTKAEMFIERGLEDRLLMISITVS